MLDKNMTGLNKIQGWGTGQFFPTEGLTEKLTKIEKIKVFVVLTLAPH